MDYHDIQTQTNIIINNLNFLDGNVSKIKKKISLISRVYKKLEGNKILVNDANNTFLIFQTKILKNEYGYYKSMYDLILKKYSSEIMELGEYIIMVLLSLHKLEIDTLEAKTNIYNRIIHIKKPSSISYGKLNEIINSTINNLKLIEEFIDLFNKYVKKTLHQNEKSNIHNNNFELTILNKKESILLEFKKHCDRGIRVIDYFKKCSDSIVDQINTSKVLQFFLTER